MHDEGQNSQNWGFEIPNEQREFHFHDTDSVPNSFCILYHILLPQGVMYDSSYHMLPPLLTMEEVFNVNIDASILRVSCC